MSKSDLSCAITVSSGISSSQDLRNLSPDRPVHFIGIGGVGMSALAKLLLEAGYTVSGSDQQQNAYTQALQTLGGQIQVGHTADNLPGKNLTVNNPLIVVSTAIAANNPELQAAQAKGWTIIHRSALLRELFHRHKTTIGLTGTHGKTTLTGMMGLVLRQAGFSPTIIAGGKLPVLHTNAMFGGDYQYAVAELDESDGTLIEYQPTVTIIANLELDHADHFQGGLAEIQALFSRYCRQLKPQSLVFVNAQCPNTRTVVQAVLAENLPIKLFVLTVQDEANGLQDLNLPTYTLEAETGRMYWQQACLGQLCLAVPGRHNMWNGFAVAAAAHQLEADFEAIIEGLKHFTGMGRRFERLGAYHGVLLVDDYAHHPTEVKATLQAARQVLETSGNPSGRLHVLFQPHRYSRLKALWDEFLDAFTQADVIWLADVYPAGEAPLPGADTAHFVEAFRRQHPEQAIDYLATRDFPPQDLVQDVLLPTCQPGDLLISMGAGDITHWLRPLAK